MKIEIAKTTRDERLDFIVRTLLQKENLSEIEIMIAFNQLYEEQFDDSKTLLAFLVNEKHIKYENIISNGYFIEPKGELFYDNGIGGFVKQQLNMIQETQLKRLDKEVKELQIEKMNYEKTIRKLEVELKISSLFKNWWLLLVAAISLGITIGKYLMH